MSDREEFSVWAFLPDDTHFPVARWIDVHAAMRMARRAIEARPDDVVRVIVTDGGDHTCFEWKRGEGVTRRRRIPMAPYWHPGDEA